jgi:hypothetical protein
MREWRKDHKLNPVARMKDNCRSYAHTYQKRGRLIPQPCAVCGSNKAEKHHPDYSKPLLVVWLCYFHHQQLHFYRNLEAVAIGTAAAA